MRFGPTYVPGVTACLRCLDAHDADTDPTHPLLLVAHLDPVGNMPRDRGRVAAVVGVAIAAKEALDLFAHYLNVRSCHHGK